VLIEMNSTLSRCSSIMRLTAFPAAATDTNNLHPGVLGRGLFELEDHARVAPMLGGWAQAGKSSRRDCPSRARLPPRDRPSGHLNRPYDGRQYTSFLHKGHVDFLA
jgi:hypothetical protein